ncbi:hypothetical protein SAMN05444380_12549 [Thermophagus xiamenensis]|uniref:Uncharacterized protein n=1 Tax=Thermophagus xiamenensis TaxID=385682 RepID=A0A1I2F172_9BACT|nr:hypothetical protein SAMN05444380_12549 [Thermophagus xiamenensis]
MNLNKEVIPGRDELMFPLFFISKKIKILQLLQTVELQKYMYKFAQR